jgi:hypothetical protein
MTQQDLNLRLCLTDDKTNREQKGQLKMQHNNGNVSLFFYPELLIETGVRPAQPERKIAQIPDHVFQLSDFTMIEMDPSDRLIVTLSGSRARCQLYFQKENDVTQFFDYIGQKVCLKHSDCNPCVLLLESLDSTNSAVAPFLATVLPKPQKAPVRISLSKMQTNGLVFETDLPVRTISEGEFRALFDADGRILPDSGFPGIFFNVDVPYSYSGKLWKLLLDLEAAGRTEAERRSQDESNRTDYVTVKRQWQSTTRRQWNNHQELRSLVGLLERDLKAHPELFSRFSSGKSVMKIAFNVLLTLSVYNWDGAAYVEGLITFLSPFLNSFVQDADETTVTKPNGEQVPVEEVEADIFSCFSRFYDHNHLSDLVKPSRHPFLKPLFIANGELLNQYFPELLQLLYQKHAYSLDFLREDCSKWFTTCFESDDIRRLWMSILSFSSAYQFFQCFTVALLFSLAPQFLEINPLNCEEFVRRFQTLKKRVGLNLLLVNTQKIRELTQRAPAEPQAQPQSPK